MWRPGHRAALWVAASVGIMIVACDADNGDATRASVITQVGEDRYRVELEVTTLEIPAAFLRGSATSRAFSLVAYWPGLLPAAAVDPAVTDNLDLVRISLSVADPGLGFIDRDQAAALRTGGLRGPEYSEELAATVYRDDSGRIRELRSDIEAPTGEAHWLSCSYGGVTVEGGAGCQSVYSIDERLFLRYRFYSRHLASWREIDSAIRGFVSALRVDD